jgi:penicillin-binding protein 2
MTPQLALRVAVVGTIALLMFAAIFFRLWFLQVLSSNQYVAAAHSNITRHISVAAQRGEILASNGAALVASVPATAVEIAPASLPQPLTLEDVAHNTVSFPTTDLHVFDALAKVLRMSRKPGACKYEIYYTSGPVYYHPRVAPIPCLVASGVANSAFANVTIKTDVNRDLLYYLAERQSESQFQGVLTTQVYERQYRYGSLAAQIFGTVGDVTSTELKQANFKGAQATDVVGQSGLEYSYNLDLSGTDGYQAVKVNSQNQFEGYATAKKPVEGANLETSLDLKLEQVGDTALAHSIATNPAADSGAWVAIDPDNGSVYGMGSLPSYNASLLAHPISNAKYDKDFRNNPGHPLINRAIDSPLPDGSTFKVITATAALESGNWDLSDVYDDDQDFCFKGGLCLQNSGGNHYGPIDLQDAIEVSDDEFFYNLGYRMNGNPSDYPTGWPLQAWASKFGIGHTTGIDLPGEAPGEIGSPTLQTQLWQQELQCESGTGLYKGHVKHPAVISQGAIVSGGCGIASADYWTVGDNVETGVGQYDDQVTPLQLAVVYAAIENGGTIVTPHIGQAITSSNGTILRQIDPAPQRKLHINSAYLSAIQQGLRLAASSPTGTSADVMGTFPEPVYGKTGTAELGDSANSPEDAWYACYVPASATNKPIVVVVNVEKGGFGDVAAAPVAREILSQWFLGRTGQYVTGTSTDR